MRFLWREYLVWLVVQVQGQTVQAKHGWAPKEVGMEQAMLEEGDKDMGRTHTVEESKKEEETEEECVKVVK